MIRTHGITRAPGHFERNEGSWWYEQQTLGFNYRMPDILAALGLSQLNKLDASLARRREIAAHYEEAFKGLAGLQLQAKLPGRFHAYHLFPVLVERRADVMAGLAERGIQAQVHYIPVHQQPFYRSRYGAQRFPGAEAWYSREISIPMFPALRDADVWHVCDAVAEAVRSRGAASVGR
jgi:dTDP-4-amino-4,6-dideoxygalactose transaminase